MPHKLLLADDSVTIQRVIELTFADEDVSVIAVGDGRQAIDRIKTERPDIVLADVGMPEQDGYEVAAFVKGHAEFAHVPVLLLTGAFEPIDESRARAVGCDGVLVKPFEPQMVINRVKDLLAGRRPAGLWTPVPAPQPWKAPAAEFGLLGSSTAQEPKAGGSVEDYFDHLDAAFADLESTPPAARTTVVPLDSSQPEPGDDTTQPTTAPSIFDFEPSSAIAPPPVETPAPARAAPARVQETPKPPRAAVPAGTSAPTSGPALAEVFAALLAAEQARPIEPALIRPENVPDETIDAIVERVVERMGTEAVQQIVLDVAERMVREEIARIKRGSS
jgi:CheY-like chemotaxis protein